MHLSLALIVVLAALPLAALAPGHDPAPADHREPALAARIDGSWAVTRLIGEDRPPLALVTDGLLEEGPDPRSEGRKRRDFEDERRAEEAFEDAVQVMRDGGRPR